MLDGCHHPNPLTRTSPFAYNVYFDSSYVDGIQEQLHSRMRCFSYSSRFNSSSSLKKVGNGVYTPDLRQQTDEWRSPNNILEDSSGICCSRREDGHRLIEPKPTSTARRLTGQRQSWTSKSYLSVALVLTNIAWASLFLLLWWDVRSPQRSAHRSHPGFEADFGTISSDHSLHWYMTILNDHFD